MPRTTWRQLFLLPEHGFPKGNGEDLGIHLRVIVARMQDHDVVTAMTFPIKLFKSDCLPCTFLHFSVWNANTNIFRSIFQNFFQNKKGHTEYESDRSIEIFL
jgi:hypothetical protein